MINTTLCYIEKDGSYLMLHRTKKQNDYNHDKWIGIGGKFESGESPEDCARREVFEETGLEIAPADLEYCGIVTFVDKSGEGGVTGGIPPLEGVAEDCGAGWSEGEASPSYCELMHIFRARRFSGTLISDCDEGELEWVPVSRMNDLPHWKGDEIFLDFLSQDRSFFSLKLVYKDGELLESFLGGEKYEHWDMPAAHQD